MSLKKRPSLQSIVDVTVKSAVVPSVKTFSTSFPPYLIERIRLDVGTATTRFEFGAAAIMLLIVSAYSIWIFFRSRQFHQSSTGFHGLRVTYRTSSPSTAML